MRITPMAMLLAALAAPTLPGAGLAQQPTGIASTAESVSIIEAVDQRERLVILRNEQGALATLFLGNNLNKK